MHLIDGEEVTNLNAQMQVDVNLKKDLPIPTENAFKRGLGRIYQFPEIVPLLSFN